MLCLKPSLKNYISHTLRYCTQMCFLFLAHAFIQTAVSYSHVPQATVQWKILGNFHVAKDCGLLHSTSVPIHTTLSKHRSHSWKKRKETTQIFPQGDQWRSLFKFRISPLPLYTPLRCIFTLDWVRTLNSPSPVTQPWLNIAQLRWGRGGEWEKRGKNKRENIKKKTQL